MKGLSVGACDGSGAFEDISICISDKATRK
jgi:hypothetical protein